MFTWADAIMAFTVASSIAGLYWFMQKKIREAASEEKAKGEIHELEKKIDDEVEAMPLKSLADRISKMYGSRGHRNRNDSGDSK